jgi:hypothetical protein
MFPMARNEALRLLGMVGAPVPGGSKSVVIQRLRALPPAALGDMDDMAIDPIAGYQAADLAADAPPTGSTSSASPMRRSLMRDDEALTRDTRRVLSNAS